jgi:hypothetical protein
MKTILLILVLVVAVQPTRAQTVAACDAKIATWTDEVNKKGMKIFGSLTANQLVARAQELQSCRDITPRPDLIKAIAESGNKPNVGTVLYAIELENWENNERLSMSYLGEAQRRLALFINAHKLTDSFEEFEKALMETVK